MVDTEVRVTQNAHIVVMLADRSLSDVSSGISMGGSGALNDIAFATGKQQYLSKLKTDLLKGPSGIANSDFLSANVDSFPRCENQKINTPKVFKSLEEAVALAEGPLKMRLFSAGSPSLTAHAVANAFAKFMNSELVVPPNFFSPAQPQVAIAPSVGIVPEDAVYLSFCGHCGAGYGDFTRVIYFYVMSLFLFIYKLFF